ncbi:MAG: 4Fe-4S dicluster domain-containing protein [Clostridiales Family XIII bacterium]|jgi:ferredoxin|nr:4Fe-4S dicluster domain-containing protein [Clostridiales Family XIII bacterium]
MKIKKDKFKDALASIAKEAKVFLPMKGVYASEYRVWDGAGEPFFERNTALPPKELLFPRSERMYEYDLNAGTVTEAAPDEKIVIAGIRPCDVRSVEHLDKVFLESEYTDVYYRARRENLTMIAYGCATPAPTCFCDSMDVVPTDAPGADVVMNDAGNSYVLTVNTPKGEHIRDLISSFLSEGKADDVPAVSCSLKVEKPDDLHKQLIARFDDPMWETLSDACLGCGCCSYICPTCYCFDIGRENRGKTGTAFRCWDSCMFSDYSRMAGGHNPRPTKKERLRNRYLHKLAYFPERYGTSLCVGCGRCIDKCPARLDITNVPDIIQGSESNG